MHKASTQLMDPVPSQDATTVYAPLSTPPRRSGPDPLLGQLLGGRFRIERLIARGGMGRVYRAIQEPLGRVVAVKVLRPDLPAKNQPGFVRRFVREASIAARLAHPHSVMLLDYGLAEADICFIAMEYLRGRTLAQVMVEQGRLDVLRSLRIAAQVASVLAAAHAQGAMHRDLKPANIFLLDVKPRGLAAKSDDFVKVVDFGLTKQMDGVQDQLTQTGQALGSPGYMAPEQIRGAEVDGRVDVYALGAVLFEMVVGSPPFVRSSAMGTMMAHVHEAVPRLTGEPPRGCTEAVWHLLDGVIARAMAKHPEDRFSSVTQLALGLEAALGQLQDSPSLGSQAEYLAKEAWQVVPGRGALGWDVEPYDHGSAKEAAPAAQDHPTWLGCLADLEIPHRPAGFSQTPRVRLPVRAAGCIAMTQLGVATWSRPSSARAFVVSQTRLQLTHSQRALGVARFVGAGVLAIMAMLSHQPAQNTTQQWLGLDSEPPGAQVYAGQSLLCPSTPCQLQLPTQPRPNRMVLHFVHTHYDTFVASKTLDVGPTTVYACLKAPEHVR